MKLILTRKLYSWYIVYIIIHDVILHVSMLFQYPFVYVKLKINNEKMKIRVFPFYDFKPKNIAVNIAKHMYYVWRKLY